MGKFPKPRFYGHFVPHPERFQRNSSVFFRIPNIAQQRMAALKSRQDNMSEHKPSAMAPAKPALGKLHFIMCAGFTSVGLASWQGLVWSRHSDHWNLVRLFALVCLICLFGVTQSIAYPLIYKHRNARRLPGQF